MIRKLESLILSKISLSVSSELAAVSNEAWSSGLAGLGSDRLESIKSLPSINNFTEDAVLSIEPVAWDEGHEELGTVGVWSSIGHREISSSSVLDGEVLVGKLHSVDGLTSSSVSSGEVTTLGHELSDDSVERASLVVEWLATLSDTLLTSTESSEVLSSLWGLVSIELHGDSSGVLSTNSDIKENLWVVGHLS